MAYELDEVQLIWTPRSEVVWAQAGVAQWVSCMGCMEGDGEAKKREKVGNSFRRRHVGRIENRSDWLVCDMSLGTWMIEIESDLVYIYSEEIE